MGTCAYCGLNRPFTKEHIWPRTLIEKYEALQTFNPRSGTFYKGEPVVRDVCAVCNNETLSPLDEYLSGMFDRHFSEIVEPGQAATLEYDYSLLLRALLKISFNSSRSNADPRPSQLLSRYAKFIRTGGHIAQIQLRLQVVTSARAIDLNSDTEHSLRPEALRVGTMPYDGPLARRFLVRLVGINSYWFYIVIAIKAEAPHKWREFLSGLSAWRTPAGVVLPPDASSLTIPVNKTTYMHPALLGTLLGAMQA